MEPQKVGDDLWIQEFIEKVYGGPLWTRDLIIYSGPSKAELFFLERIPGSLATFCIEYKKLEIRVRITSCFEILDKTPGGSYWDIAGEVIDFPLKNFVIKMYEPQIRMIYTPKFKTGQIWEIDPELERIFKFILCFT